MQGRSLPSDPVLLLRLRDPEVLSGRLLPSDLLLLLLPVCRQDLPGLADLSVRLLLLRLRDPEVLSDLLLRSDLSALLVPVCHQDLPGLADLSDLLDPVLLLRLRDPEVLPSLADLSDLLGLLVPVCRQDLPGLSLPPGPSGLPAHEAPLDQDTPSAPSDLSLRSGLAADSSHYYNCSSNHYSDY